MGRQCESKRQRGICIQCRVFKPIKAQKQCQGCWRQFKIRNRLDFFIRCKFTQVKQRCTNVNNEDYMLYHDKLNISATAFFEWSINDSSLKKLYNIWQKNNFDFKLTPSIDRINNNSKYELGNIQWITHSANCSKDTKKVPVDVYSVQGEFLGSFESVLLAATTFDVCAANAWKVISGERKHSRNKIFKIRLSNEAA